MTNKLTKTAKCRYFVDNYPPGFAYYLNMSVCEPPNKNNELVMLPHKVAILSLLVDN